MEHHSCNGPTFTSPDAQAERESNLFLARQYAEAHARWEALTTPPIIDILAVPAEADP